MFPVMWRQHRAGAPRWLVVVVMVVADGGQPGLLVTTPALAAHGAVTGQRAVLMRVETYSIQAEMLVVAAI